MKVLFLNNFAYLRGGSERVLFGEMSILRARGYGVAIYARQHEKNESQEFAHYFPQPLETEKLLPGFATLRTVKELIYSPSARSGLREVINRFRPDIVHAHNIYGRLSLSVLDELKAANIPVVMTLHDYKLLCPSYLMLNDGKVCERCKGGKYYHAVLSRCHKRSYAASCIYALESWLNHLFGKYQSVSMFIAPSRFMREKCIVYGCEPSKIVYIPNFIDTVSVKHPVNGSYLIYMGRLSREKGITTLIQVYNRMKVLLPLKIVGDGPIRKELEKEVLNAGSPVHFTGFLKGAALEDALSSARAMVLPSEWYENAPLSILEAFANYKPVIGARIGGIPEMIDDGVNGFLFEPGNVEDMQKKIKYFLSLPDHTVLGMGKAARGTVEKTYNAESHYEHLINVYHKALGSEQK